MFSPFKLRILIWDQMYILIIWWIKFDYSLHLKIDTNSLLGHMKLKDNFFLGQLMCHVRLVLFFYFFIIDYVEVCVFLRKCKSRTKIFNLKRLDFILAEAKHNLKKKKTWLTPILSLVQILKLPLKCCNNAFNLSKVAITS